MTALPDLAAMRHDYARTVLDEAAVAHDPLVQFERWLNEAISGGCAEPAAMTLATAATDTGGLRTASIESSGSHAPTPVPALLRPSARIVLLKAVDAGGLVFFTSYESRKGRELAANPYACLLFFWVEMEREVRIEGRVEKISALQSDAYFASRPLKSRLGAWASPQSEEIASRAWLEARFHAAGVQHGADPARPPHWGGYRLVPSDFEFWQGRADRLHDRISYARDGQGWRIARLAP